MSPDRHTARYARRNLKYIFAYCDTEPVELGLAFTAVLWAAVLLLPWHTFSHSPTYAGLAAIAPEWVWGLFVGTMASGRIYALMSDSFSWRTRCAFVATLTWIFVSVCFATTDFRHTGMAVYPMAAVANAWCYIRLLRARRHYHA